MQRVDEPYERIYPSRTGYLLFTGNDWKMKNENWNERRNVNGKEKEIWLCTESDRGHWREKVRNNGRGIDQLIETEKNGETLSTNQDKKY